MSELMMRWSFELSESKAPLSTIMIFLVDPKVQNHQTLKKFDLKNFIKKNFFDQNRERTRGCIFSHVQPFYELAVSDLDP
jgi:hypothetical protein